MFLLIQPFIDEGNISAKFDFNQRVYEPVNFIVRSSQIPSYLCPSDEGAGRLWVDSFGRSNYVVNFGSKNYLGPNWSGRSYYSSGVTPAVLDSKLYDTDGSFRVQGKRTGRRLKDFEDGSSHTAMVSEVIVGLSDAPGDLADGDLRGIWMLTFPGMSLYTHWLTPNSSAPDSIYSSWCKNNPQAGLPCATTGFGDFGNNYAAARSKHAGGVNVGFVDGHTDFYADATDSLVWRALSTLRQQDWESPSMR